MRFDINDTGKYFFDQRQSITPQENLELEKAYYEKLKADKSLLNKNCSVVNNADKANHIAGYFIVGIAVIVPLLMWFVILGGMTGIPKIFLTIGFPCIGIGIALFVKVYLRFTVKKRVYSESVDAECIGYARYYESSGGNDGPIIANTLVSPVFKYRYEGTQYTSCYDGFELTKDSSVPLGAAKINISPSNPESIFNRGAQENNVVVLFAVVFFLTGIGFTIAGLMI